MLDMIVEVDGNYFELFEKIEEVILVLMKSLKILEIQILRYEKPSKDELKINFEKKKVHNLLDIKRPFDNLIQDRAKS